MPVRSRHLRQWTHRQTGCQSHAGSPLSGHPVLKGAPLLRHRRIPRWRPDPHAAARPQAVPERLSSEAVWPGFAWIPRHPAGTQDCLEADRLYQLFPLEYPHASGDGPGSRDTPKVPSPQKKPLSHPVTDNHKRNN